MWKHPAPDDSRNKDVNAKTPWRGAVKACHWLAACALLVLAACVVVEGDLNLVDGTGGGGSVDLDGGRAGAGGTAPGTAKKGTPTPAPKATSKPTPTPAPIDMAADGWEDQPSGTTEDLHALTAKGLGNGRPWAWAVGAAGTILRTSDGGATWQKMPSGTTKNLYTVSYFWQPAGGTESYTVLAGGDGGTLLLSTDNGASWSTIVTGLSTTSPDPIGDVRYVDIWPTGTTESTRGRTSVFVSSSRYPLIMSPNASTSGDVVWDAPGKFGKNNAYPIPYRDDNSWPVSLTAADGRFRFSFYSVASTRAYGLLLAWDKGRIGFCPNGAAICIGYPANLQGDWPWRWRGSVALEGEPTDLAAVPDNLFENAPCDIGENGYVAYLSTTKALYRTVDYGKTWNKIRNTGADRIYTTGIGRIVAVSNTRIWHGKAVHQPVGVNQDPCPKALPTFDWIQVVRGTEIDVNVEDNFIGGVRSTDFGKFKDDLWLVGKGGKILHRLGD